MLSKTTGTQQSAFPLVCLIGVRIQSAQLLMLASQLGLGSGHLALTAFHYISFTSGPPLSLLLRTLLNLCISVLSGGYETLIYIKQK